MTDFTRYARIEVGVDCNTDFKLIGRSGADLTDEIPVCSFRITGAAQELTRVELDIYADVSAGVKDWIIRKLHTPEELHKIEKENVVLREELDRLRLEMRSSG